MWPLRRLIVITGLTGSGKTDLLARLAKAGEQVIDLEALARHRGSVFGGIGAPPQPTHRRFGALVRSAWDGTDPARTVWIEDEGPFLGSVGVPVELQRLCASAPAVELVAERAERADRLLSLYGGSDVDDLLAAVGRAAGRLSAERLAMVSTALRTGDRRAAVATMLDYYDAAYSHRMTRQPRSVIARFPSDVGAEAVCAIRLARRARSADAEIT